MGLRGYIVDRTRNVWLCACVGLWFIERGILHLECAFLGFCACVGLWFIEQGILNLECAFLGFCTCVGLWFIERGVDISKEAISKTSRFWMFWYKRGCNWLGAIKGMALWSRGFSRGSLIRLDQNQKPRMKSLWQPG